MLAGERIHGDDTTMPVLAKGKTITGRLWGYVRDDQPFGGPGHAAAIFHYSRDRGGKHPCLHLKNYAGILQAYAYAGFNDLYNPARKPGPIAEAACWSHGRRKLFVLADVAKAPLAIEAVRRIDAIFDVEREIDGLSAEQRHAIRQVRVAPLVASLEQWRRGEGGRLSSAPGSPTCSPVSLITRPRASMNCSRGSGLAPWQPSPGDGRAQQRFAGSDPIDPCLAEARRPVLGLDDHWHSELDRCEQSDGIGRDLQIIRLSAGRAKVAARAAVEEGRALRLSSERNSPAA